MKKCNKNICISIFLVFFLTMIIPALNVNAASGDFYNLTKKATYKRVNLMSDEALITQLELEMDNGDIIGKEIGGSKVINYTVANNNFLLFLKTMPVQQALMSVLSSEEVKIDRNASGLDNFEDATTSADDVYDVDNIY